MCREQHSSAAIPACAFRQSLKACVLCQSLKSSFHSTRILFPGKSLIILHATCLVFYTVFCVASVETLHKTLYYTDTSALLENTPLVKFIRNHMRDSSGVFSISSLVRISMLSLISSLSHKLYLNSLLYDQNIFGSSSKVVCNLRQSSVIFGNFRKMFSNVRATFGQILENHRNSSESGQKSSENRQLRRHQYVYIIKRTLHVSSKI